MTHKTFPLLTNKQSCYFDLMRFIAVQLVVAGHLFSFMHIVIWKRHPLGIELLIQNLGVVLFFILSGYLISYSLYRNLTLKSYSFREFFKDRFFRIYITLLPCLIFIIVVDSLMPAYQYQGAFNLKTLIGNLFMLQDYPFSLLIKLLGSQFQALISPIEVTSFGSARPLWTLAIEWWLYMAFGWFILKLMPVIRSQYPVNLGNLSLFVFWGLLLIVPIYNLFGRGNGLTLTWLLGAALFLINYYVSSDLTITKRQFIAGNIACIILIGFCYHQIPSFYEPRLTLVLAFLFNLNLFTVNQVRLPDLGRFKHMAIRLIRLGGGYSYALYLVHYTVIQFFVNLPNSAEHKFLFAVAAITTSNIVALFIYFVFDKNHKKVSVYVRNAHHRLLRTN